MLLKEGVKDPIIISPLVKIIFNKFSGDEFKKIKAFVVTSSNAIEAIKKKYNVPEMSKAINQLYESI